jgi:glycine/D-amino acid oxidase-like deaminating enzyme
MSRQYDTTVVGGGFYGCMMAVDRARAGERVLLVERGDDLLGEASYANQARVHQGYHYPRSFVTAVRSRESFERFVADFPAAIDRSFEKYYAVGRELSKVTAGYFETFCRRIGAPIDIAPRRIRELFSEDLVEQVFLTREYAFNAVRLRDECRARLRDARVEVETGSEALVASRAGTSDGITLSVRRGADVESVSTGRLLHCAYSQINGLLERSALPLVPLKHEIAELALVEPPPVLRPLGITLMCGPFFSCMPFPARGLHSLSHVRYTPHLSWKETPGEPRPPAPSLERESNFSLMVRDGRRYLPSLADCRHVESLFAVKTVLPVSEADDSRPILFKRDWGLRGLHVVMGSKIDNVYDALDEIRAVCDAGARDATHDSTSRRAA